MKKLFKTLIISVLAVCMVLTFAACGTTPPVTGGGNGEEFGITTRPDNDFEKDPNRHDRKPVPKTLKLKGGATFADGSTEKIWDSGSVLEFGTDIKVTVPEGKQLGGWLADDSNDPTLYGSFYAGEDFVTLRKDAAIQPVFDVPSESYAPETVADPEKLAFGKVSGFAWEQRLAQTSLNGYVCKDTLTYLSVNGEKGAYFHVRGGTQEQQDSSLAVPAGWHTLFLSKYQVVDTQAYGVTYTVQNFGDEAVDVRMYQTNSSGSPMPSNTASAPVHIESGKTGEVFVSFSGWKNGNLLASLELMNSVKELKVGIYGYVSDHSEPQSHKLTLTDGAIKTEEDKTIADVPAGKLVEISYTGTVPSDKLLMGWQDKANKSLKYPVKFLMPDKPVEIEPWLEAKADHMHTVTLTGDNISFAGGAKTKELCWTDTLNLADIIYGGEIPRGHKVIYKVSDGLTEREMISNEKYTMPDSDITISFAETRLVWSPINGKVALAPFTEDIDPSMPDNTHGIRRDRSQMAPTGGDLTALRTKYDKSTLDISASIGDIDGEDGAIYDLRGFKDTAPNGEFIANIAPDAVFMQQINHSVVKGQYTDTVTLKNFGTEAITVQIHVSLSSGNYKQDGSSEVVTLAPGEIKKVSYNVNFTKNNSSEMISIQYKGAAPIAGMKLGMYIYRQPKAA